ncbi:MAG: hypothetical protein Q9165_008405 [Trypethelium subeluteriae]
MQTSFALRSIVLLSLSQLATLANGSPLNTSISLIPSISAASPASSTSCSNGARFTAINGDVYQAECNVDRTGGELAQVYVPTFTDCLEACSQREGCIDITFEGTVCYLKYVSKTNRQGLVGAFRINKHLSRKGVPAKRDVYARQAVGLVRPFHPIHPARTTTTQNITESYVTTQFDTSTIVARPTITSHPFGKLASPEVLTSTVSLKIGPRDPKKKKPSKAAPVTSTTTISSFLGAFVGGTFVPASEFVLPKTAPLNTTEVPLSTVTTWVSAASTATSSLAPNPPVLKSASLSTKTVFSTLSEIKAADQTLTLVPLTVADPKQTKSSVSTSGITSAPRQSSSAKGGKRAIHINSAELEPRDAQDYMRSLRSDLAPIANKLGHVYPKPKASSSSSSAHPQSVQGAHITTLTVLTGENSTTSSSHSSSLKPKTSSSSSSAHSKNVQAAHVTSLTVLTGKNSTTTSSPSSPRKPTRTVTAHSTTSTTSTSHKKTFTTSTSSLTPKSTTTKYLVSRAADASPALTLSAANEPGALKEKADGATVIEVRPSTTVTVTSLPPKHSGKGRFGLHWGTHHTLREE